MRLRYDAEFNACGVADTYVTTTNMFDVFEGFDRQCSKNRPSN